ncbi:hypothetical protein NL676_030357 [Syzygium grande]|nr:hypothetical protein NL676_030357 [Syzygium grande]
MAKGWTSPLATVVGAESNSWWEEEAMCRGVGGVRSWSRDARVEEGCTLQVGGQHSFFEEFCRTPSMHSLLCCSWISPSADSNSASLEIQQLSNLEIRNPTKKQPPISVEDRQQRCCDRTLDAGGVASRHYV